MSNLDSIKKELLSHIDPSDTDINIIYEELKTLESTSGINDKNNLEAFYDIYKKMQADGSIKKGNLNKINSLLAFKLGMTSEKPNGEFLPKRRAFARAGFPDIDTDFDYERRQEVYDYIIDKYGRENVGNIGTYGLLKMKSFIRRAFKSIDPDKVWQPTKQAKEQWKTETNQMADQIIKSLPPQYGAILKVKDDDGEEHAIKTVEDAYKYCKDFKYYIEKYPDLLKHSKSLEGLVSVYGCVSGDTPVLTSNGYVRIDQIPNTAKVAYINHDESVDFTSNFYCRKTGKKQTYLLKLDNGNRLRVTDEHLMFTDKGIVKFEDVRKNPEGFKILCLE